LTIRVKRGGLKEGSMARPGRGSADDDLDLDGDEPFGEPRRPPPRGRSSRRKTPPAVQPWDASGEGESTEEWALSGRSRRFGVEDDSGYSRPPVYWRARDSLYFEPLVALSIVVLMLVGLFAFTQNWPPAYVVESGSMRHGTGDHVGDINAGDMVLAEKVAPTNIVPYVVGYRDGVRTYGEYGDVVLYHPNGNFGSTPIVHRAILYLQWDPGASAYNATDLQGLPCGHGGNRTAGELYYSGGGASGCGTTDLNTNVDLYNVGWNSSAPEVILYLGNNVPYGHHSGFVTMGDYNPYPDQTPTGGGGGSTPTLSALVEPGWVIGVARGMLPWFGAIKLLLQGNAQNVSSGSWQFLGLAIIAAILSAFGIHYALKTEGIESPLRRREEEEAGEFDEDRPRPPRRFLGGMRAWGSEDADDRAEEDDTTASGRRSGRATPTRRPSDRPDDHRGRRPNRLHPSRRKRNDEDTL
jgi:signal peptidase I